MSVSSLIQWTGGLLPAAAVAAIVLFMIRELLEWIRRRTAHSRQIGALKKLLARECELNLWTMNSLKHALESADGAIRADPPRRVTINKAPSGHERWREFDDQGDIWGGGPLPMVRRNSMEGAALRIAELDGKLFSALELGLEATAELDHLRGSLIDYTAPDPVQKV